MPGDPRTLPARMLEQARAILYAYSHSTLRFIHNNAGRHHIEEINQLIGDLDKGTIQSTACLLEALHRIKLVNSDGALGKAIGAIHRIQIRAIEEETWFSKDNTLLHAICQAPEAFPALLAELKSMPQAIQARILSHTNHENMNCLMLAICYQPALALEVIKTIKGLTREQQKNIITPCSLQGSTVLMMAALRHTGVLIALIQLLISLKDKPLIKALLCACTPEKSTVLMIAIQYQPRAVPHLFKLIKTLNSVDREEILQQTNYMGFNIYQLSLIHQPDTALPRLIISEQDTMLSPLPLLTRACYAGYQCIFLQATRKAPREPIDSDEELELHQDPAEAM